MILVLSVHLSHDFLSKLSLYHQASQDSFSVHPKLVKKLKDYYTTTDPDRFFEDFIFFMKIPISGVTERSPFIDRTLGLVQSDYRVLVSKCFFF